MTRTYDQNNPKEVYKIIKAENPQSAKWTQDLITPYIREDVDKSMWLKMLKAVEYNINNPKPKRKSRRSAGTEPKGYSPARDVLSRLEVPR